MAPAYTGGKGSKEMLIAGSRLEFQDGKSRVCIVSPCGSGKTVIMAYMASQARILGNRTLFAVHRQELIQQSSDTFKNLGVSHGIIASGYPIQPEEYIQIASAQTVVRRLNKIYPPQIIIFDEAHHSTAALGEKL